MISNHLTCLRLSGVSKISTNNKNQPQVDTICFVCMRIKITGIEILMDFSPRILLFFLVCQLHARSLQVWKICFPHEFVTTYVTYPKQSSEIKFEGLYTLIYFPSEEPNE